MKVYFTQFPFEGIENTRYYVKQHKFTFTAKDEVGDPDTIITVDPKENTMVIDLADALKRDLPEIDVYDYQEFFLDDPPQLENICTNKKCKSEYYLMSLLQLDRTPKVQGGLTIRPIDLLLEGFRTGNYTVMTDYELKHTKIYSARKTEADPIVLPMMDFSNMSKDRIINRVKTLVTFS